MHLFQDHRQGHLRQHRGRRVSVELEMPRHERFLLQLHAQRFDKLLHLEQRWARFHRPLLDGITMGRIMICIAALEICMLTQQA